MVSDVQIGTSKQMFTFAIVPTTRTAKLIFCDVVEVSSPPLTCCTVVDVVQNLFLGPNFCDVVELDAIQSRLSLIDVVLLSYPLD